MSPSSLLSPASLLSHTGLLQTFTCLKNYSLVILILNCFSDDDWIKGPAFNPQLGLQIHALQKGIICKYKYKYKYMRFKKVSDITYRITHPSLESVHPSICVFCERPSESDTKQTLPLNEPHAASITSLMFLF